MKLLNYIFLVTINANQLNNQNVSMIEMAQCNKNSIRLIRYWKMELEETNAEILT